MAELLGSLNGFLFTGGPIRDAVFCVRVCAPHVDSCSVFSGQDMDPPPAALRVLEYSRSMLEAGD